MSLTIQNITTLTGIGTISDSGGGGGSSVQYESTGDGDSHSSGLTLTWNHTVPSVSDGYLVAFITCYGSSNTVVSATYDGSTMTQISSYVTWSDGGTYFLVAFGIANPASGVKQVQVTLSGGGEATAGSVAYSGVSSLSATTNSGSGAWSDSVTVPNVDDYVSHAFGSRLTTPGDLSGGTIRYNNGTARNWLAIQDTDTSTTFSGSDTGRGWGAVTVTLAG